MHILRKIVAGSEYRRTRAHTEKGELGFHGLLDSLDCVASLHTCGIRVITGTLPALPWLTYPAIRFLESRLTADFKIFEYGGGMSTLWYENRCSELHTVEDNPDWCKMLSRCVSRAHLIYQTGDAYIESIHRFTEGFFDMIVIDGSPNRLLCFEHAQPYLKDGGLLVVDDTDKNQVVRGPITRLDEVLSSTDQYDVQRFPGWVPGSFCVKETTIAVKKSRTIAWSHRG